MKEVLGWVDGFVKVAELLIIKHITFLKTRIYEGSRKKKRSFYGQKKTVIFTTSLREGLN